jgi:hypothetical protein
VQAEINLIPLWATEECRVALRSTGCMEAYVSYSTEELTFCNSDCAALLTACTSLEELLSRYSPSAAVFFSTSICPTQEANTSVCAEVGTATAIAQDKPLCPEPALVVPDALSVASMDSSKTVILTHIPGNAPEFPRTRDTTAEVVYVSGTGCAYSCPFPMYTQAEYVLMHVPVYVSMIMLVHRWKLRKIVGIIAGAIGAVASLLAIRKALSPLRPVSFAHIQCSASVHVRISMCLCRKHARMPVHVYSWASPLL